MPKCETPFKWPCPFCNSHATIQDVDYIWKWVELEDDNADPGRRAIEMHSIKCPNPECARVSVWAERSIVYPSADLFPTAPGQMLDTWRLIPPSEAKVFPKYVPQAIREDYEEACLIRDLSPKASATLSRRCLQGMIRDYWGVRKRTLKEEIDAIKDKVKLSTWENIETVRTIGKIGAHMEKNINIIVDVEPTEAQLLIELIEQLVNGWYIARHEEEERHRKLKDLAAGKDAARRNQKKGK